MRSAFAEKEAYKTLSMAKVNSEQLTFPEMRRWGEEEKGVVCIIYKGS